MKKSILGLALLAACVSAFAGASSTIGEQPGSSIVPFNPTLRVRHFAYDRNSISADGVILVCPHSMSSSWNDSTCKDANGANAWTDVQYSAPNGYKVQAIEYRFPGSGGYRNLIVYYVPR